MSSSIRVIPAVLTDDPETLNMMLLQVETFTDYVQIDIMDSRFVPSRSVTCNQITTIRPQICWEAHLMVEQPEKYLDCFKQAGAQKAIFHYEATTSHQQVITIAREAGIEIGLAVNPETPVSSVLPFTDQLDSVLFLSVHPGFYGAKFIPGTLDKIAELRKARPNLTIGIDGGIKENNITQIARSGVNEIFVGSAIFLQPQPAESYRNLLALAQNASSPE
jgi:ribulose-phosphate 3-epimerase